MKLIPIYTESHSAKAKRLTGSRCSRKYLTYHQLTTNLPEERLWWQIIFFLFRLYIIRPRESLNNLNNKSWRMEKYNFQSCHIILFKLSNSQQKIISHRKLWTIGNRKLWTIESRKSSQGNYLWRNPGVGHTRQEL